MELEEVFRNGRKKTSIKIALGESKRKTCCCSQRASSFFPFLSFINFSGIVDIRKYIIYLFHFFLLFGKKYYLGKNNKKHEHKVYKKKCFYHLQNILDTYPWSRVHYDSQTFVDFVRNSH